MKKDISWKLKNPRSFISSAHIVYYRGMYLLSYGCSNGYSGGHDSYETLRSAKTSFSRNVIQPKYWGKNIWEKE